jgi:hypothetical protein
LTPPEDLLQFDDGKLFPLSKMEQEAPTCFIMASRRRLLTMDGHQGGAVTLSDSPARAKVLGLVFLRNCMVEVVKPAMKRIALIIGNRFWIGLCSRPRRARGGPLVGFG